MLDHEWRGNVRELEKTVKRMIVLADEGRCSARPAAARDARARARARAAPGNGGAGRSLRSSVSDLERRVIQEALERNRWNKAKVARELGLSYPTLLSRIKSLQLERRRS
jgi:Response regulator containing CheY-like receiver, AAA-type ATPase, and DNA-binding domains